MIKRILFLAAAVAVCGWGEGRAEAGWPFRRAHGDEAGTAAAQGTPWHGQYYSAEWGTPVALVVPPTAGRQTHMSWGVGGTRITTNYQQFNQNYPGPSVYDGRMFRPAPVQPTSTDQMGYYYVRSPWH